MLFRDPGKSGALFSKCRKYRYLLTRTWSEEYSKILCVMLNPSTADEVNNDPTVTRMITRSKRLGYGGIWVCNLFAFRATDPRKMKAQADPVGILNDKIILNYAKKAATVFVGWGSHGAHMGRSHILRIKMKKAGISPYIN